LIFLVGPSLAELLRVQLKLSRVGSPSGPLKVLITDLPEKHLSSEEFLMIRRWKIDGIQLSSSLQWLFWLR